ncbi:MAG TPA: hypothetical protein VFZ91_16395 [Allosphingosinicella sp.]
MFGKLRIADLNRGMSAALLPLLLAACAAGAGGTAFQRQTVPTSRGIIYVYKGPNQIGAAQGLPILLDGNDVGILRNGGYLAIEATPGRHFVDVGLLNDVGHRFAAVSSPLPVEVQAGGDRFVSVIASKGPPSGYPRVDEVYYGRTYVFFQEIVESNALTHNQTRRLSQQ